jgi:Pyridoxamine 5'-phosphate oxidase
MLQPKPSRPYWPDALQHATGTANLKPWSWAETRLQQSHNYWIATSRPGAKPHLMIVWGLWWRDAFWFSTGPRTRKAKNLTAHPECVIATERADEAVILEGFAEEVKDRAVWKEFAAAYDTKYGGDLESILVSSDGSVLRVTPRVVFAQDEHATDFVDAVTRWTF